MKKLFSLLKLNALEVFFLFIKKNVKIILFLFVLLLLTYFLIPGFTAGSYEHKVLNSFFHNDDLKLNSVNTSKTYVYKIYSAQEFSGDAERNSYIAQDNIILKNRLEQFLDSEFEIRSESMNGKILFTIYANEDFSENFNILTNDADNFEISIINQADPTQQEQQLDADGNPIPIEQEEPEPLNLSRGDFGRAEVRDLSRGLSDEQYQVRLPIGINLSLDKIRKINENTFEQLSSEIYGASFVSNFIPPVQGGSVTYFAVSTSLTKEQAQYMAALLNSDPLTLDYAFSDFMVEENDFNFYKLILFLIIIFTSSILISKLYMKQKISLEKDIFILVAFIGFIGFYKFFNVPLDTFTLIIASILLSMTVMNTKFNDYLVFGIFLTLISLFGLTGFMKTQFESSFYLTLLFIFLLVIKFSYPAETNRKL